MALYAATELANGANKMSETTGLREFPRPEPDSWLAASPEPKPIDHVGSVSGS